MVKQPASATAAAPDPTPCAADGRRSLLRGSVLLGSALATGWLLGGCGSKPKPPPLAASPTPAPVIITQAPVVLPTVLSGTLSAASNLNLSVSQRPSPLVVRLYELRSATAFAKADFTALHQADVATLGGDLVLRDELLLQPGESRPWQRTLSPETRFIGVFGVYRDVERAVWRASAAVTVGRTQKIALRAEGLALSLQIQP